MSEALRPLPWHGEIWATLSAAIVGDRLGHALLVTGSQGAGKKDFARCLAAALWCRVPLDGAACGRCADCRQVLSEAHSGFHILRVEEDRRDISIEAVRDLIAKLHMTSHDGRAKVAIVEPADALNVNGVNALLKTIEEPAPRSHLILISERPQALPATLRSRCQRIRLALPAFKAALVWLSRQVEPNADDAPLKQALLAAHGSPLRARHLIETEALRRYSEWAKSLLDLAAGKADPVPTAAAIGEGDALFFTHWLYGWLTELLRMSTTHDAAADAQLRELARTIPPDLLDRYVREVQETLYRVRSNANKILLLESLLIAWVGLLARTARTAQNAA